MTPAAIPSPGPPSRPRYLRPLPPADTQLELDHDLLIRSDQIVRSDRHPLRLPHPVRSPGLDRHQARVAVWLTLYAVQLTPKSEHLHPVHYQGQRQAAFHGATGFVLRYGSTLILQAIHELTYWHWNPLTRRHVRCWADDIVSPARRLYAYVRDLDALSRDQDNPS